jgi:site-specific recombinase XerD
MSLEEYIQNRFSSTCQNSYLNGIKRYLAFMNNDAVNSTYQDVLDFIAYLRTTKTGGVPLHPKTLMNYLFSVKIYYQWLLVTEQRDDHPCKTLYLTDQISKAIPVETLYSEAELQNILANHKPVKSYIQYRDKVMLSLLVYQALATSELVNIQLQDLDLEKGTVHIKHLNVKQDRKLALQSNQILLIYNYLNIERPILLGRNKDIDYDLNKPHQNVIINNEGRPMNPHGISRHLNQHKSKNERIIPFKIRQSAIKNLLRKGNDLRVVQVFAGHKRSSSTEAYKQTGLEELKNIIQKLHPLA